MADRVKSPSEVRRQLERLQALVQDIINGLNGKGLPGKPSDLQRLDGLISLPSVRYSAGLTDASSVVLVSGASGVKAVS
jgi:hypothetical protein